MFFLILTLFHHSEEKGLQKTREKNPVPGRRVFSMPEISLIDNRDYAFGLMTEILGICCRAAYSHLLSKPLRNKCDQQENRRKWEHQDHWNMHQSCLEAKKTNKCFKSSNVSMYFRFGNGQGAFFGECEVQIPHIITAALCSFSSFVEDSASTSSGVKGWTLGLSVRGASPRQKLPLFSSNRGAAFRFTCVGSLLHSLVS